MTPATSSTKLHPAPDDRPAESAGEDLLRRLCDVSAPVVFFPVRHHSPAAGRLQAELIAELRPAAVLIEGPSDYNPDFAELLLAHELPIAIYSYFQDAAAERRGAYYPF